jgi:hypothetical protein
MELARDRRPIQKQFGVEMAKPAPDVSSPAAFSALPKVPNRCAMYSLLTPRRARISRILGVRPSFWAHSWIALRMSSFVMDFHSAEFIWKKEKPPRWVAFFY